MDETGAPDEDGYARLLDFMLSYPICGIWMLGSASEDFLMSYEHRLQTVRTVTRHLSENSHLIVGCADPVLSEVRRFFDDTDDLAIDGYHLLPPDRKMSEAMTIRYCTMIADRAPKSLWLYNNEKRALHFSVGAVRELATHPNIVGIKVGGYDLSTIIPVTMMATDDFQVIGSGGSHLLVFLALGSTCHTVSPACCFPAAYCEIFSLWQGGQLDEARDKAFAISRILKALPHPDNTEFSAEEKIVLEIFGICKRHVHPPFRSCTDEEKEETRRILLAHGILQEEPVAAQR